MSENRLCFASQQVGAADVADEHEIPRENQPRHFPAARFIEQRPRKMFERVAGSMHRLQPNVSQANVVAVFHGVIGVLGGPLGSAHRGTVDDGFIVEAGFQLAAAADEVGMDVSFENMFDVQPFAFGQPHKFIDIARGSMTTASFVFSFPTRYE